MLHLANNRLIKYFLIFSMWLECVTYNVFGFQTKESGSTNTYDIYVYIYIYQCSF